MTSFRARGSAAACALIVIGTTFVAVTPAAAAQVPSPTTSATPSTPATTAVDAPDQQEVFRNVAGEFRLRGLAPGAEKVVAQRDGVDIAEAKTLFARKAYTVVVPLSAAGSTIELIAVAADGSRSAATQVALPETTVDPSLTKPEIEKVWSFPNGRQRITPAAQVDATTVWLLDGDRVIEAHRQGVAFPFFEAPADIADKPLDLVQFGPDGRISERTPVPRPIQVDGLGETNVYTPGTKDFAGTAESGATITATDQDGDELFREQATTARNGIGSWRGTADLTAKDGYEVTFTQTTTDGRTSTMENIAFTVAEDDATVITIDKVERLATGTFIIDGHADGAQIVRGTTASGDATGGHAVVRRDGTYSLFVDSQFTGERVTLTAFADEKPVATTPYQLKGSSVDPTYERPTVSEVGENARFVTIAGTIAPGSFVIAYDGFARIGASDQAGPDGEYSLTVDREYLGKTIDLVGTRPGYGDSHSLRVAVDLVPGETPSTPAAPSDPSAPAAEPLTYADNGDYLVVGSVEDGARVRAFIGDEQVEQADAAGGRFAVKIPAKRAGETVRIVAVGAGDAESAPITVHLTAPEHDPSIGMPDVQSIYTEHDGAQSLYGSLGVDAVLWALDGDEVVASSPVLNQRFALNLPKALKDRELTVKVFQFGKLSEAFPLPRTLEVDGVGESNTYTPGSTAFTGSAEAGATIVATDQDGAKLFETKVGATKRANVGTWNATANLTSTDGYQVTFTQTTTDGRTSVMENIPFTATPAEDTPFEITTPTNGSTVRTPDKSVTFTGTGKPGGKVSIMHGARQIGTQTIPTSGTWTITGTMNAARYDLTVFYKKTATQSNTTSQTRLGITVEHLTGASFTITSPTDGTTVDRGPIRFEGTGKPGGKVSLHLGGTARGTTTVTPDGTWHIDTTITSASTHTATIYNKANPTDPTATTHTTTFTTR